MNKKAYLLAYDSQAASKQDEMGKLLNQIPEIITWRYDLPNAFYLISEHDAGVLTEKLRAKTGAKGRFIIVEITGNRNGWLTPDSWHLINQKVHKPKV
jgi:hypothetical protein